MRVYNYKYVAFKSLSRCSKRFPLQTGEKQIWKRSKKAYLVGFDACGRSEVLHCLRGYQSFALANMPLAEEKLPVQIAGFDGVHVDLRVAARLLYYCVFYLNSPPQHCNTFAQPFARLLAQLTTSMFSKPLRTSVFRSSQPIPPAPTART